VTTTSKILWGEGQFLRPQHFQQQDQYHETCLHEMANAMHPYLWGIKSLEWDKDALKNNILRPVELFLIFQDGEIYSAPAADMLPEAINLNNLPASLQTITYYAALPPLKKHGGNFAALEQTNNSARYAQANLQTHDLYTAAAKAEVAYLKKTVHLVSEMDPLDCYINFPLARLRRASTGGFELDPEFIPPSLSIHSTPELFLKLRRLLDALHAKINALYGHHREPSKHVIEFRSGDISSFWLLHTASSAFATLTHFLHHPALHPERLFQQLLGLAGALMTYSKNHSLIDLPTYRHEAPGPGFARLDLIIRSLLDTVISTKYFSITLDEIKPSYHHGKLDSGKISDQTTLYLAVSAAMSAIELVEIVPLRFKVGAPDDVEKFVLSAMPGVKLVYSPQVPAAIPVRSDTYYFSIENRGAMAERMLQSQSISVYVPAGVRDLELNLIAVAS
jgi:type VI secretion system protein ImpJ